MSIWQRGTTGTATTAGTYISADRWCDALGTSGTLTLAQSATIPAGAGFLYSLSVATTITTASTPLIEQRIESVNVQDIVAGTSVTVSFWASQIAGSTLTPLQISLFVPTTTINTFSAQSQTGSTITTPTLTATLTNYTATFTLTTVGTLTTSVNAGLALRFTTGTNTTTANTYLITGVQLEKGRTASPFEFRPYAIELAVCQRYCQIVGTGTIGRWNSTTQFEMPLILRPPFQAKPSVISLAPPYTSSSTVTINEQGISGRSVTGISVSFNGTTTDTATGTDITVACTTVTGVTTGSLAVPKADLFLLAAEL
jgi:hypothetical protein